VPGTENELTRPPEPTQQPERNQGSGGFPDPSQRLDRLPRQCAPVKRPIVTVTLYPPAAGFATQPTTLAHELGHALTGDPDHSRDADCLMAGGNIRNAQNTLSDGRVGWFRNNPWT
jgi:hypothetical protein